MRLAGSVLSIIVALVPLAASAVDVQLGIKTEAGYDNNVGRSANREGDFSFRFSPDISFAVQDAKFGASLRYVPTYEAFVTFTELNDLTHSLSNRFSYAASNKTKLTLSNLFRIRDVLNLEDSEFVGETPPSVPDNDVSRDRILTFESSFNLSHSFSPRWSGSTDVGFTLFEAGRTNSSDSRSLSAFQSFSYAINAANRVGVGGGGVVQMFDGVNTLPGSKAYVFRAYGSYVRNFGERTTLSISVGPAVISNNQDSVHNTFPDAPEFDFAPVNDDTTVGELRKEWRTLGVSQGFADEDSVPKGSVIVPDAQSCTGLDPNLPAVLIEGSGCRPRTVLRIDSTDAGSTEAENNAVIGVIRNSKRDVEVIGSTSGSDETKITVFGDVTLNHIWMPNLTSALAYNRSQGTAAGQGVGTIADSLSLLTTWRPTPPWNLSIRATYVKRESPNNLSRTFFYGEPTTLGSVTLVTRNGEGKLVEVSNSVDTQRWGVAARAARRISRRMTASLRAAWSDQKSNNSSRNPNNFSVFTIFMGIKYDFDPLRF